MKKIIQLLVILTLVISPITALQAVEAELDLQVGDLVKLENQDAVYCVSYGTNLLSGSVFWVRQAYPNQAIYNTWRSDFNNVKTISSEQMAEINLIDNVVVRPGTKLVKITTVPKVYAVGPAGLLYHIKDEAVAERLYGEDWASKVIDISDAFWPNYIDSGVELDGSIYPEGQVVRREGETDIYYVDVNNIWVKFTDEQAFLANNFRLFNVVTAPADMEFTLSNHEISEYQYYLAEEPGLLSY